MNLFHRELFPVYTYTIGTEEHPAQPGEVEQAQLAMDDLRTEGGMVMPFRHKLEIVGSEGKTLEVSHFMDHMKERVAVGLGVFPHHLGMVSFAGANKDMTDRLDASLYARVKEYQRVFADFVRMFIFDELLREGGFDPMMNPKIKGEQDRCVMLFDEIDQDGQIKKEAHAIQKATTGVETMSEVRTTLGRPPEMDEADTVPAMQQRLTPTVQAVPGAKTQTGGQQASKIVDVTPSAAQKSSTGGTANMKNLKKGAANVVRPSNQHGARTSPNIRRSDDDWYNEMVELVGEDYRITEEEA